MRYTIPTGVGFNVSADFARAPRDCELIEPQDIGRGLMRGYVHARPDSKLGFMRHGNSRGLVSVTVQRSLLKTEG